MSGIYYRQENGGVIAMKKRISIFCMVFSLVGLYLASLAGAAENGEINWVGGYVSAIGYGAYAKGSNMAQSRPMARRAAMADAYRNLLETIKGIKLDSSTTVENFIVTQDVIKTQIDGVVKGAKIYKETYEPQSDGSALSILEIRVCISSCPDATSIVQALNIEQSKEPPYIPQTKLQDIPVINVPPPPKEYKVTYDSSKPVTGIIVNLEGLIFERVLLPVVVAEGLGDALVTVYSAKNVNPAVIRTQGIVRYNDTVDQARSNPRIGNNIMIIPVSRITKENMIVIKGEAARLIKETTANGNDYLTEGKIVISAQWKTINRVNSKDILLNYCRINGTRTQYGKYTS